jgi:two-component system, cell cycle response regulator
MRGPAAPAVRAPVGATPSVRQRLAVQRPRPLLVRLYAALLSDLGLLGGPARRRGVRLALRSLPAVVAVALGALVPLRAFDVPFFGWPQIAALATLAFALGALVWRRVARAAQGEPASHREQLELGSLFVVAAYVLAQSAAAGGGESAFQAVVYLVMAFLVAFSSPGSARAPAAGSSPRRSSTPASSRCSRCSTTPCSRRRSRPAGATSASRSTGG